MLATQHENCKRSGQPYSKRPQCKYCNVNDQHRYIRLGTDSRKSTGTRVGECVWERTGAVGEGGRGLKPFIRAKL